MLLVAALALTGCSAATDEPPEATSAPLVAMTSAPPATPTPAKPVDVKAAKAESIEAGRPVPAWDKNCVAWEVPNADTKGQAWANKLGTEFLKSRDAECPDQVIMPYYYIESFEPGEPGELIVRVEPEMNRILGELGRGSYVYLVSVAEGVMDGIMDSHPDVKKVTALTPTGKKYGSTDRARTKDASKNGGIF